MLGITWLGGWTFGVVLGLVGLIGAWEWQRMMPAAVDGKLFPLWLAAAFLLAIVPTFVGHEEVFRVWILIAAGATVLPAILLLGDSARTGAAIGWSWGVCGTLYVGLLLGHLNLLRHVPDGGRWVLSILLLTWSYDTGALLAGRLFGTTPFMAHISPRKTWEGVAGGVLFTVVVAFATVSLLGLATWQALVLGILVSISAQTGDIVESWVKRSAEVKDSGTLLPGHGGILDRIDSLLLTAPVGYYLALLYGHASS